MQGFRAVPGLSFCLVLLAIPGCAGSSFRAVSDFTPCQGPGCAKCKGSSNVTCPVCEGATQSPCRNCDQTGVEECNLCGGDGHVGKGRYNCSRCAGHGRFRCPRCQGGAISTCRNCKGTGKIGCGMLTVTYHCTACGATYREEPDTCARCGKD
jgi:hypothetical protein